MDTTTETTTPTASAPKTAFHETHERKDHRIGLRLRWPTNKNGERYPFTVVFQDAIKDLPVWAEVQEIESMLSLAGVSLYRLVTPIEVDGRNTIFVGLKTSTAKEGELCNMAFRLKMKNVDVEAIADSLEKKLRATDDRAEAVEAAQQEIAQAAARRERIARKAHDEAEKELLGEIEALLAAEAALTEKFVLLAEKKWNEIVASMTEANDERVSRKEIVMALGAPKITPVKLYADLFGDKAEGPTGIEWATIALASRKVVDDSGE